MTPEQEQQLLKSLAEISLDMKALLALRKDLLQQQGESAQRAYTRLVSVAHKR